jgi:hypothetical protein
MMGGAPYLAAWALPSHAPYNNLDDSRREKYDLGEIARQFDYL